ncbi:GNAT family N-acetyltransferase [Streptacidiphilus rugosus]|uniref:GNAT family N-acetyltransferase n=1 Tax=Streptacidiphilus rugosus TaxID=405783 RepID=UPI000567FC89|nr:GNAT family N-acetyltransferase [Streptacidiphilus rugosus]
MIHDAVALDDPVAASLDGHHAHLARRLGRAATFLPDVATFSCVSAAPSGRSASGEPDAEAWADLARLLGPGAFADMFSGEATPPADWEPVFVLEGRQMILPGGLRSGRPCVGAAASVVELGPADVPEMLDLVALAQPGPFRARTRELGAYLGVRENGALVAMAGERLRPPGWTELSAVCTAPAARGRGYASLLVGELVARVEARGEHPFLHVAEANAGAIGLYESMGFESRRAVTFRGFRTP